MANLTESPIYETGIFQLEKSTPPLGGAPVIDNGVPSAGHANAQGLQLANRTAWLKTELNTLDSRTTGVESDIVELQDEISSGGSAVTLKSDLQNNTDSAKGASLVGFDGGYVNDLLSQVKTLTNYSVLRSYTGVASRVTLTDPGIGG